MTDPTTNPQEGRDGNSEDQTPLLDFFLFLARRKRLVIGIPFVCGLIAVVFSLVTPKWYMATTKIMPPQQSQSNAVAILGQLGALTGGAATQALGLKNPSDIYVAMLKSRTIADALVERFNLQEVYGEDLMIEARRALARNSTISAGREGVITIDVEDRDPKRAAELANAYVAELRTRTLDLAVSEAGQRRLFFEGQLKKAKTDLTTAEVELKRFTQEAGLVNPQGQVGLTIAAAASLRAQITAKEIQLTAMRSFATDNNPELKRTQQELSGLRSELGKMEKDAHVGKGDIMVAFGKAPEIALEYTRRFREMRYQEVLFDVLSKQYEIARIDEAKDATLIQVLDAAVPPEQKSRPKRALIVILTVLFSGIAAIAVVLALERIQRLSQMPGPSGRLRELQALLRRPR